MPPTADEAVVLQEVAKRYRLGSSARWAGDLRDDTSAFFQRLMGRGSAAEPRDRIVEAVKGVNVRVRRGENVGFVGPNGAGKSTILKLVARITRPSAGHLWVRGRVAALIAVGAGFHRELTGRENVFLKGAMLGLTRKDVEARYDEIVAFSELGRFMDTPVKRYSSGMFVRLGFSVAVHVDPDVLIVDEALAVGDQAFRNKCLERMQRFIGGDTTVLFVSHNRELVENVCQTAYLLDQGQVTASGSASEILNAYDRATADKARHVTDPARFEDRPRPPVILTRVELCDDQGNGRTSYEAGSAMRLQIHYESTADVEGLAFQVTVQRNLTLIFKVGSRNFGDPMSCSEGERGVVELRLERVPLLKGTYAFSVEALVGNQKPVRSDYLDRIITFHMHAKGLPVRGMVDLSPSWHVGPVG